MPFPENTVGNRLLEEETLDGLYCPSDNPDFNVEPGELQELHHGKICRALLHGLDPVEAAKDPADRVAAID